MSTLSTFKDLVTAKPLLQQTYYKVSFDNLSFIGTDGIPSSNVLGQYWDIYVQSSKMPGKTLTELELKRHAITFRMPNVVEWDGSWNCTVLLDLSMTGYKQLLRWQSWYSDIHNEHDGGGARGFPKVTAKVEILNNYYEPTGHIMTLYGIYPKVVPALEFNQETSEYIKPDIEFGYSYADDMLKINPLGGPSNA